MRSRPHPGKFTVAQAVEPAIFFRPNEALDGIVKGIVAAASRRIAAQGGAPEDLALTLVIPGRGRALPFGASHRGQASFYPASVVKLFYLVAVQAWLADGRMRPTDELWRALRAMIRESSNDATNHIVDLLSGTTGGPDLPPAAFERWCRRRQAVNRYFAKWRWPEFDHINVCQKTWEEGPYGRERQSRVLVPNSRNRLTTHAVARLLWAIERNDVVSPAACRAMRALLARNPDPERQTGHRDNQIEGFFGEGLPAGSRLWSKAGWTSDTRHDAAIVRLPTGRRFILVAFTAGVAASNDAKLLPLIARLAARAMARPLGPMPRPGPSRGRPARAGASRRQAGRPASS